MSIKPVLSSQLASTYRLFLRATSAAVLHHSSATKNLRRLYRPDFVEAAQIEAQLKSTEDSEFRRLADQWLMTWNQRIDNTLDLLHNSATTKGLAHRLTRNISFLIHAHLKSRSKRRFQMAPWQAQLPASSPNYTVRPVKISSKQHKLASGESFNAMATRSLDEVMRLAEGRSGVYLGHLPFRSRVKPSNG